MADGDGGMTFDEMRRQVEEKYQRIIAENDALMRHWKTVYEENRMTTRAKFYVSEVKQSRNHYGGQEGELLTTIKLMPVTGTSEENKTFFRWTPVGSIDLGTVNPSVVERFHIGDEFYVDFIPAKSSAEGERHGG